MIVGRISDVATQRGTLPEAIVRVLKANRVPHLYKLYEGEGHGFRKKINLIDYYETIDSFLKQYVIFSFKEEA